VTPASRLSLLTRGQRRLLAVVLAGAVLMLADSAWLVLAGRALGVGDDPKWLPLTYQAALVLHVAGGALLFVPTVAFALWHLRRALRGRAPATVPTGIAVLALAAFLFLSGFFILSAANSRQNQWAFVGHQVAAALLPLAYLFHRLRARERPAPAAALRGGLALAALVALFGLLHAFEARGDRGGPDPRPPRVRARPAPPESARAGPIPEDPFVPFVPTGDVDPASPFFPSSTTTTTGGFLPARIIHHDDLPDPAGFAAETRALGFAPSHYLGAQTCVRCHPDVVEQWARSAHRFASFNNPFYRRSVELTRETRGKKTSQWCGGCHDPAIMLAGNMTNEIDPLTPESQAGLTCLACHAIDRIHDQTGNGAYNVEDEAPSPYVFEYAKAGLPRLVHDYVLKAKPTVHKREMLKPVFRTSEFCSSCHKVNLDVPVNGYRWLRGQNDYDSWHDSGIAHNNPMTWYQPPAARNCQDCHMAPEPAVLGDVAAKGGMIRSHRFLAVNTALPHIRGDRETIGRIEAFLRDQKLRVDLFAIHREDGTVVLAPDRAPPALRPGETIQVDVVVRNLGVGHIFPGGTNDSNEGWIDFRARAGGREAFRSGGIRPDRHVDPGAHFFQAVLVDKESRRIERRNPADIHAPVYANVVGPGSVDVARYRFRVPEAGPLELEADLNWRKFNRTFTEFVYEGKPVPDLPVTTIASAKLALPVGGAAPPPAKAVPDADWVRFNDYGIGLVLDGDTRGALAAFARVAELRPAQVDGWRNQARVYLEDGSLEKAEAMMRKASEVAPEEPRNAFFWGRVLEESGRLEEAVQAYRRTLQDYPRSRGTWARLGRTHWLMGRHEDSIRAWLEVLRIDPEDALAHHQRMLAYQALAAEERDAERKAAWAYAAAEAGRAFEKYKIDETAQAVTLRYRQEHPHENRMSQRIVIHEPEGP
jgi:hypothetical protein